MADEAQSCYPAVYFQEAVLLSALFPRRLTCYFWGLRSFVTDGFSSLWPLITHFNRYCLGDVWVTSVQASLGGLFWSKQAQKWLDSRGNCPLCELMLVLLRGNPCCAGVLWGLASLLGHVLVHSVPPFVGWRVEDESQIKALCQMSIKRVTFSYLFRSGSTSFARFVASVIVTIIIFLKNIASSYKTAWNNFSVLTST